VALFGATQPLWKTTPLFSGLTRMLSPRRLRWASAPGRLGGSRCLTVPAALAARLGSER